MSEIKKPLNPQPNPVNPAPSAMPPLAASPQSNPAPSQNSSDPNSALNFHSSTIGNRENAKNKDYFAEQNQKSRDQKRANSRRIRRYALIASGVIALLLAIWFVWQLTHRPATTEDNIPTITNGTTEEIINLQKAAQAAFDNDHSNDADAETNTPAENTEGTDLTQTAENLDAADAIFDRALASPTGAEYKNQILLAKMIFYAANDLDESAIGLMDQIKPDNLPLEQRATLYGLVSRLQFALGDEEESEYYGDLETQAYIELGNGTGGGE